MSQNTSVQPSLDRLEILDAYTAVDRAIGDDYAALPNSILALQGQISELQSRLEDVHGHEKDPRCDSLRLAAAGLQQALFDIEHGAHIVAEDRKPASPSS